MKTIILFLMTASLLQPCIAQQNVAINTTGALPHASAQLDISSTTKGILIPRMTSTQRTAITSPATSLMVFDTDTNSFWFYNGTSWTNLAASSTSWLLNGNAGTNPSTNYIGTSDNIDLRFKINSVNAGLLGNNGNVFWGLRSGNNSTGFRNIGIGRDALKSNTTLNDLVAIGDSALFSNVPGSLSNEGCCNTAIGTKSLLSNTTGSGNTATGYFSLHYNTTGAGNTAFGSYAMQNNNGYKNTGIGENSLQSNSIGTYNIAVGSESLNYNTSGSYNVAIGTQSSYYNNGNSNTAVGTWSLGSNTTGHSNVAIGPQALYFNTVQSNLVAIGDSALLNNGLDVIYPEEAIGNTAVGSKALYANRRASDNTAIGFEALKNNSGRDAGANTAIGFNALLNNTTGSANTAVGSTSLQSNTTGYDNTTTGVQSLYYNTLGSFNTATGRFSLYSNSTGSFNTAYGRSSLNYNTSGDYNSAVGANSLFMNTTGFSNVAIGYRSMYSNTTGYSNIAIGIDALNINSTWSHLVAIGDSALFNLSAGEDNTAIGSKALTGNVIGEQLTAIGSNASVSGLRTNATVIGAYANANCDNCMVLGTQAVRVGIGVNSPTAKLSISSIGTELAGTVTSSVFKTYAGDLGINTGDYLKLGNIGFSSGNFGSLGIRAYRHTALPFGDWHNVAIMLSYDVDNTFNAAGANSYIAISGNGGIGIGTTTPERLFSVAGAMSIDQNNSSNGSLSSGLTFGGGGGEGIASKKTAGGNQYGLDFYSNFINRMSITNSGNVGIGITNPQAALHLGNNGVLRINDASGTRYVQLFHSNTGNLHLDAFGGGTNYISWYGGSGLHVGNGTSGGYGSVNASAFIISSSILYKKEIRDIHYGLSQILQLQGKEYKYIHDSTNRNEIGLIAEEVEKILPEVVYRNSPDKQITGIDYGKLTPVLIEAVKELQKQIEELKKENAEIKNLLNKK